MKYFNNNINKTQIIHKNNMQRKREEQMITASVHITLLLSAMALRDEFDFGGKRLERFLDKVNDKLDTYDKGYASLHDYNKIIYEETGIKIMDNDELDKNTYKYKE